MHPQATGAVALAVPEGLWQLPLAPEGSKTSELVLGEFWNPKAATPNL